MIEFQFQTAYFSHNELLCSTSCDDLSETEPHWLSTKVFLCQLQILRKQTIYALRPNIVACMIHISIQPWVFSGLGMKYYILKVKS